MVDERYYLGEEEFYLLLAGKGVERWYGMSSDQKGIALDGISAKDIYRILAGLYQKGFVSWDGDSVRLEGIASEMMKILLPSRCCMRLEKPGSGEEIIFYFNGSRAVMLELSRRENRTFRISILTQSDVLDVLKEESVFPEEQLFYDAGEENPEPPQTDDPPLATLIFIHPREGRELEKILIRERGIDTFMDIEREMTRRIIRFTPEIWQEELLEMCSAHDVPEDRREL